jgi:SAM-dependent methyltransferase
MDHPKYENCDQAYYQKLHDENPAFQQNNWMLSELEALTKYGASSVIEIGCGNGKFLSAAAASFDSLIGIDWAHAPALDGILRQNANVRFVQADLIDGFPDVSSSDLLVSADFLEHLPTDALRACLRRYHGKARFHFHKIACYDDGHSHLSILDPADWLEIFKEISSDYVIFSLEKRFGDSSKLVCCITNHNPHDRALAEVTNRLTAIEASGSWRITAPYRKLAGKFR